MNKLISGLAWAVCGLSSASALAEVTVSRFGGMNLKYGSVEQALPLIQLRSQAHSMPDLLLSGRLDEIAAGKFAFETGSYFGGTSSVSYSYNATFTNDTAEALAAQFKFSIDAGGFLESSVTESGAVASFALLNLRVSGYGVGPGAATLWQSSATLSEGILSTTGVDIYSDVMSGGRASFVSSAASSYVDIESGTFTLDLGVLAPGASYSVSYQANAISGDNAALFGESRPAAVLFGDPFSISGAPELTAGSVTAPIPEPSTYGLLALGLALVVCQARSRRQVNAVDNT